MNIVDHVFPPRSRDGIPRQSLPALITDEETISYGQLETAVALTAARLMEAGFPIRRAGRVPRIGLAAPNSLEHVILALAILQNGGCLVPIAGELTAAERGAILRTVGVDALVISDSISWPQVTIGDPEVPRHRIDSLSVTLLPRLPEAWRTPEGRAAHDFCENDLAAVNPAFIRFSSGTTGQAKGVVLSHATLLSRLEAAHELLQIRPGDRILWVLSMAHHFAVSIMLYLVKGAATIIANSPLADPLLTTALAHKATLLYASPFHHALLAAEPSGRSWPTLRLAVSTAAALPERTATAFLERFDTPLTQGLGMIEAGLPLLNLRAAKEQPTALGSGHEGAVKASIRHPESGAPLPPGEPGELWLSGPGFFDAYLSPWQPREQLLHDGWLRTGDLAVEEEGLFFLKGRLKTVINVGGMKCFPEEIEAVLEQHPGVREARVYGRENARFGSVPVAEVVAATGKPPGHPELIAHCRERLALYKIPVDFHWVAELPRTASGKVRRFDEGQRTP